MGIDQIKVSLIDSMGNDKSVVNAARASFKEINLEDTQELTYLDKRLILFLARGIDNDEHEDLVERVRCICNIESLSGESKTAEIFEVLWRYKNTQTHFAPFAHPQVSFSVSAPIAVARQLWKSHVGASGGDCGYPAWSEKSFRYTSAADVPLFTPTLWRPAPKAKKQGSLPGVVFMNTPTFVEESFKKDISAYCSLLEHGVAPEQARLVLPTAHMTTWQWTGSLMFFARICYLRDSNHAQEESRRVAVQIDAYMKELFPVSWEALRTGNLIKHA